MDVINLSNMRVQRYLTPHVMWRGPRLCCYSVDQEHCSARFDLCHKLHS